MFAAFLYVVCFVGCRVSLMSECFVHGWSNRWWRGNSHYSHSVVGIVWLPEPVARGPLLFRIHRCCGAHRVHDEGVHVPVVRRVFVCVARRDNRKRWGGLPLYSVGRANAHASRAHSFSLEACAVDGDILIRVRACAAAAHHFGVRSAFLARHVVCGPVRVSRRSHA